MFNREKLNLVVSRVVRVARESKTSESKGMTIGKWIGLSWDGRSLSIFTADPFGSIRQEIMPEWNDGTVDPFLAHISAKSLIDTVSGRYHAVGESFYMRMTQRGDALRISATASVETHKLLSSELIKIGSDGVLPFDDQLYQSWFTCLPYRISGALKRASGPLSSSSDSRHAVIYLTLKGNSGLLVSSTNGHWAYLRRVLVERTIGDEEVSVALPPESAKRLISFLDDEDFCSFELSERSIRVTTPSGKFTSPIEHRHDPVSIVCQDLLGRAKASHPEPCRMARDHIRDILQAAISKATGVRGDGDFGRGLARCRMTGGDEPGIIVESEGLWGSGRYHARSEDRFDGVISVIPQTLHGAIRGLGATTIEIRTNKDEHVVISTDDEIMIVAGSKDK